MAWFSNTYHPMQPGQTYADYAQAQKDASRKKFITTAAIASAALAGGAALPAAFGGAASAVPASVGTASAAPVSMGSPAAIGAAGASRFSLSNLLDLGKLASGLWGTISGNKANANAQAATLAEQKREFDEQQRLLAENEATRKAEALRVSDEQARQWEAGQQFQGQQWRSQEEQRLHDRALLDAAEARKAPRRAVSQQALMSLSQFLGLGRR